MVSRIFSWHTLGPLVPTKDHLNTAAFLSIVAEPFMTTVDRLLMATSIRIMHHVTKLRSSHPGFRMGQWLHFTSAASSVTRSQANREPLRCEGTGDLDHRCADLQQLRDANMLLWTKISEECLRHLFGRTSHEEFRPL